MPLGGVWHFPPILPLISNATAAAETKTVPLFKPTVTIQTPTQYCVVYTPANTRFSRSHMHDTNEWHIVEPMCTKRVFTNSPQYKNVTIAKFVLAVPLEIHWVNEIGNLKI